MYCLRKQLYFLLLAKCAANSLRVWWFSLAKQLTRKEILAIIIGFMCKSVKVLPSGKPSGMVREVDDGPKTDWLLRLALEKFSGAVRICWSKLGILK